MATTTEPLLPGWDELMALPALVEGQSGELRIQTHDSRVWTARGGLSTGEPYEHTVYVETVDHVGRWLELGHYSGDLPPRSLPGLDANTLARQRQIVADEHRMRRPEGRVRAFLDAYPHDGSSNVHPEHIYTFNMHTLTWSDLDALCRAVSHNRVRSDDG